MVGELRPDLIYLNSFFAPETSLLLLWRKIGLIPRIPVLVAPRGEFGEGAIQHKELKKRIYLAGVRWSRLYDDVALHASTGNEKYEIHMHLGEQTRVLIAPNIANPTLTTSQADATVPPVMTKESGGARFIFLARIVPKKNLLFALQLLAQSTGNVTFHVFGPIEDVGYWRRCMEVVERLPDNVSFAYGGEVSHDEVGSTLAQYDFLLFPTQNENFGHTISESLQLGLPVLISDQTPWTNLGHHGVGWDLPLNAADAWRIALGECVTMADEQYQAMSARARLLVPAWLQSHGGVDASRAMLREAIQGTGGKRDDSMGDREGTGCDEDPPSHETRVSTH
jgi:glycosyltransferase involved in cell wall biosynthesis